MTATVTPEYRESFFYTLVDRTFPGLRQHPPAGNTSAFGEDVHVLYDFSLQHPHAAPFNLQHGTPKQQQRHLAQAEQWLKAPKQSMLYQELQGGFTDMAAAQTHTALGHNDMPSPIKHGQETAANKTPSTLTLLGRTAKATPGAAVHDVGKVAGAAGGWFTKNPVVLIIIVLVIVLVIKK